MKQTSSQAVAEMILAQNRDKLQSFKVVKGTNIFEERHAQSMRHLTLSICNLESSGLEEFGPLLSNLTSLNLEYSSGVTDDSLLPILDRCHQLVKLDLTEVDCTQVVIQGLSAASDSTTSQQGRLSSMKRLILNNIDAPFTANLFIPLAKACPNLEALHMNSILADSFSDFELFISKMQRIRDLDIGNVFPEFSDDNLKSLVNILPDLRWLSIANTQITNESLVYLSEQATNLCDLCILGCDQVTKMGVIEFLDKITAHQRTTVFKRLDITYCRLDEGAVTEIRERAKSVTGIIEIEGDDQFTDSIDDDEEGDREEGVENDDHEGSEDEEQDFEYDENDGYDVEEYQEDDDIDGTNNSAIESAVQIEGLMSDYSDEEM
ncbi:hypothetical protein BCR41DRAFT_382822 [Lobosporangium transversale]|uniref:Uncharacterized protein n=1 Tax=Lobosporangium transversale TaxID=64571 RepID=A0A1Y2H5C8_9FUNG|nr:hypothetical protein BCR41DRAFT_382822 [Lobosporangium transversale]ORZ28913.1 hypothetical protein BCR41DRAFT_382822 [Lobosporangium transversale]|eukprot:XP_021886586.1 hypothetical protein BCR41DRAFT_382822 [Lobosporangium transversale]